MQAFILYVGMCRRSCASTNKLVFVCNRCAPETWGATLQVTSSPGLSLLTWETKHCICASVGCRGARTLYLPPTMLIVHTFHESHKELDENFQTKSQADVTHCLSYSQRVKKWTIMLFTVAKNKKRCWKYSHVKGSHAHYGLWWDPCCLWLLCVSINQQSIYDVCNLFIFIEFLALLLLNLWNMNNKWRY